MPTYQYRCSDCGTDLEIFQKFSDAALTTCQDCRGVLRKVYNPVGVVFKGSGFYATDSRSKSRSSLAPSSPRSSDSGSTPASTPSSGGPVTRTAPAAAAS